MQRIPVTSSNIRSIGYDPRLVILEVEFTSGDIYRYFNVPEHLYRELMKAPSKDWFLNEYIRYSCRYQKVG